MAEFTAKDVMALRQKTGMGMMDCKKALQDAGGDMQNAAELLRERMKGKMDARTERATAEGRIGVALENGNAVIVEVRSETDFTAKNDAFATMVDQVAKMALNQPAGDLTLTEGMREKIDDVRVMTKENVNLARGEKLEGGSFGVYVHHDGKLGVVVQFEQEVSEDISKGIAQHIAALGPAISAMTPEDLPHELVEGKRAEALASATREVEEGGKPKQLIDRIAKGYLRKFFNEQNVFLYQNYVKDPTGKKLIIDVLPEDLHVRQYVRYLIGAD